jgi:hypothetical protein
LIGTPISFDSNGAISFEIIVDASLADDQGIVMMMGLVGHFAITGIEAKHRQTSINIAIVILSILFITDPPFSFAKFKGSKKD